MSYNELPNWYGIGFEWRGSQSDALLHYKGRIFNDPDIEDAQRCQLLGRRNLLYRK